MNLEFSTPTESTLRRLRPQLCHERFAVADVVVGGQLQNVFRVGLYRRILLLFLSHKPKFFTVYAFECSPSMLTPTSAPCEIK